MLSPLTGSTGSTGSTGAREHGEHGSTGSTGARGEGRVRVSVERARMIGNKPYLRTMLTWRHFAAEETKGGLLAATDASCG
jgi:hypothetical protein